MIKQQSGFTLIELVLVIVILGILAATALPRFSDLSQTARIAAIGGLMGGMQSAAAIAHSTQLARGLASGADITLEGGTTATMSNGYPTANNAGIGATLTDTTGFTSLGTGTYTKDGAPTPASCTASYAASVGGAFPVVSSVQSGC